MYFHDLKNAESKQSPNRRKSGHTDSRLGRTLFLVYSRIIFFPVSLTFSPPFISRYVRLANKKGEDQNYFFFSVFLLLFFKFLSGLFSHDF
jgi:Kef-type K+ transport system membrane component KefB